MAVSAATDTVLDGVALTRAALFVAGFLLARCCFHASSMPMRGYRLRSTGRASGLRRALEDKLAGLAPVPDPVARQVQKLDTALGGTLVKSLSGNATLTQTEASNTGYNFTGNLSSNATITFPAFRGFLAIVPEIAR